MIGMCAAHQRRYEGQIAESYVKELMETGLHAYDDQRNVQNVFKDLGTAGCDISTDHVWTQLAHCRTKSHKKAFVS